MHKNQIAQQKVSAKVESVTQSLLRAFKQKNKQLERLELLSNETKVSKEVKKDLLRQIIKIEKSIDFVNSTENIKDEVQKVDKDMKGFFNLYSLCQDEGISAIVKIMDIIPRMARMAKRKTSHAFSITESAKLKASQQLLSEIQKSKIVNRNMRYELKKIQPSHVSPGFYAEISAELALKEANNLFKYRRPRKK